MNALVPLKVPPHDLNLARDHDDAKLAWLQGALTRNAFLPMPPQESVFVGDGDFRAIGAEFLGHFVRLGGLSAADRVIDIGCGIGRMAIPLTQFLEAGATYDGVDPVLQGISWCTRTVTPVYPNFRFCRLDVAHPLYNPEGQLRGTDVILPFSNDSFDFAAMVSVATHLTLAEIKAYADEVYRLLAPGGRLFMTAFIIREGDVGRKGSRIPFLRGSEPGSWIADPAAPLAAIGFNEGLLEGTIQAAGLRIERVGHGHWRGLQADHYQDLIVASKPRRDA